MKTELFKNTLKDLKGSILQNIRTLINKQSNSYLRVEDLHGDLVINVIDDQESEVIQSITIKDVDGSGIERLIAWYGVYEEDNYMELKDCSVEKLLDILGAVERELE